MTRPGVGSAWGGDSAGSRRVHVSDRLFEKPHQAGDISGPGRDQFRDQSLLIDRHRTSQIKRGELRESPKIGGFLRKWKVGRGTQNPSKATSWGSIPPPGTKYLIYLQPFTVEHRAQGRSSRFDPVQIRYSEYPIYFQYVEDFWHVLFVNTLYIVSFAYARLRSAQRIIGSPRRQNLRAFR